MRNPLTWRQIVSRRLQMRKQPPCEKSKNASENIAAIVKVKQKWKGPLESRLRDKIGTYPTTSYLRKNLAKVQRNDAPYSSSEHILMKPPAKVSSEVRINHKQNQSANQRRAAALSGNWQIHLHKERNSSFSYFWQCRCLTPLLIRNAKCHLIQKYPTIWLSARWGVHLAKMMTSICSNEQKLGSEKALAVAHQDHSFEDNDEASELQHVEIGWSQIIIISSRHCCRDEVCAVEETQPVR